MTPRSLPTWAFAAISSLFALSGATGLAYEVIWFKRFGQVWGHSSLSLAAVVACFLFGLGLGARLFGPIADASRRPLRLYALCELAIAALALAVPFGTELLAPLASKLYGPLSDSPLLFALARFAASTLVLGAPTILMGATLPLLVRQLSALQGRPDRATSWLYFLNSFGAAAGAWATGFFLLPALGLGDANVWIAGANVAIACAAFAISSQLPSQNAPARKHPAPENAATGPGTRLPLRLLLAALFSGAAGVGLQVVWTRQVILMVGGSTYAFTAVLSVFVLGIALGSLAFRWITHARPLTGDSLATLIGVSAFALAVTSLAGQVLRPSITSAVAALSGQRVDPSLNALVCAGASAALELLPTFCMGLLFPALVRYADPDETRAGRTVGRLYAWNTAGSIVGATITGALLFPLLGTFGSAAAMLALYGAAVALLYSRGASSPHPRGFKWALVTLATALAASVLLAPDAATNAKLNAGAYLYGNETTAIVARESELLFFEEGRTSNVMVLGLEASNPTLAEQIERMGLERLVAVRVDGKVDGSISPGDMQTQLGSAYLPHFLRPRAARVLSIGYGTGTSAGASLLYDHVSVDCCEIEPAILAASPFFRPHNHAPLESPRYRTILEDGRNYVQSSSATYDLIVSVPSNPWIAGIGALFTTEFYAAVRARLTPGGLLGQWVQAYQLGPEEFALILNSVREHFPHAALIRFNDADTLLVASLEPILPPAADLDRAQALVDTNTAIATDLERYFGTTDVRALLLGHLLLDEDGLQRFANAAGQSETNTDSNLRLEFDAPRRLFEAKSSDTSETVQALFSAASADFQRRAIQGWGWTPAQADGLGTLRGEFARRGRDQLALEMSALAVEFAPTPEPEFLVDLILATPAATPAAETDRIRKLVAIDPEWAKRLGSIYGQGGDPRRASVVYEQLLERFPDSVVTCAKLGLAYHESGRAADARTMAERAQVLGPDSEATRALLEILEGR